MAIHFQGLDPAELRTWTAAMAESGERPDLGAVPAPTVDKHSTGGVGDKVSLILAPLVASCGAAVPQLSGRGLGHTGGTLDKLESVRGWRAGLSPAEMIAVLNDVGCVICAAGPGLAPADRRLYALRDVTGTVDSIPLVASSIMSKKIAERTAALVLDVKVGSGAFMRDLGAARLLAETMVTPGAEHGVRTSALLTRMDTPLGYAAGNAVEVQEAVVTLRGGGCAGSRLLVQEPVADRVVERLKRRIETLRLGDPLDEYTDIGAINSPRQLNKIRELSAAGEAEGAGRWSPQCQLPQRGYWFPPTVFTGVSQSHRIAREEIFGPVLSVLTFRTPDEAVSKANNTPYGLSAGVWTEKGSRILWMAQRLRSGVVWANTYNRFDPASPFGGYRESGFGREGGRHGLEAYLDVR